MWINWIATVAGIFAATCGGPEYAACFEQRGVTYLVERDELKTLCPTQTDTQEAADFVLFLTGTEPAIFNDYFVLYVDAPHFDVNGVTAIGVVYVEAKRIKIADARTPSVDHRVAILRHEFLHVALAVTTGDADYYHEDSRWSLVN